MAREPLVLIHPFPLDRRFWAPMLGALDTDREVILHELPGFGDAPRVADWSIQGAAEEVAERIAVESSSGRAVAVGLSMGGYVCLALAAHAPSCLAGLVLADTRAESDSDAAREGRAQAIASIRQSGAAHFLNGFLPNLTSSEADDATLGAIHEIAADQEPETLIAALEALRDRPDRVAELPAIAVPTLVLVGADDAVTPPEAASTIAHGIPRARLEVIPAAGHLSALEQPNAFAAVLADFLGSP